MTEEDRLVVIVTNGCNDERSSVAWRVANGGGASGMAVTIFLASPGADRGYRGRPDSLQLSQQRVRELLDQF